MSGIVSGLVGIQTQAAQPGVLAYISSTDTNVTGNNALATLDFDTEIFDQNNDFASDTFTAPVTGRYLVTVRATTVDQTTSSTGIDINLVASNRTFRFGSLTGVAKTGRQAFGTSCLIDMDAADTATVTLQINGEGSDLIDILGDSAPFTFISFILLA